MGVFLFCIPHTVIQSSICTANQKRYWLASWDAVRLESVTSPQELRLIRLSKQQHVCVIMGSQTLLLNNVSFIFRMSFLFSVELFSICLVVVWYISKADISFLFGRCVWDFYFDILPLSSFNGSVLIWSRSNNQIELLNKFIKSIFLKMFLKHSEHSIWSFCKHNGSVTFECSLSILKQAVTFKKTLDKHELLKHFRKKTKKLISINITGKIP